ncbi:ShlB/FhaC/HecB family hemolysin secretion/activation protein [Alginatibacterium sediminis]|nr:ShlB/FhaC/HecB family hemolysin secretion/activation protein [Alginatibacterium sediminis]
MDVALKYKQAKQNSFRNKLVLVVLCFGSFSQTSYAESEGINAATLQQQQRQEINQRLQEQQVSGEPIVSPIQIPEMRTERLESKQKLIELKAIQINESALLNNTEITELASALIGKNISLFDLQTLLDQINAIYANLGHATARAILPAQTIENGLVRVQLVEAKLGDLNISGNQALKSEFVQQRIPTSSGEVISVPELEAALVRFNRIYDNQLGAGIAAGKEFGTTDIDIQVSEPKRFQFSFFLDNAGRYTVGDIRGGLVASLYNPFGNSDKLTFITTQNEGAENYSLYYTAPLNRHDLMLDLIASKGKVNVVDGPFETLDITGDSSDFSIGLSYPLRATIQDYWSLYGNAASRNSKSYFSGFEQDDATTRLLTLGISTERQTDSGAWVIDNSLVGGRAKSTGIDENSFFYYRGSASRFDRFESGVNSFLKAGLQLSSDKYLASSELYQVGGSYTVRGYSEGLLSGHSGYFVSAEVRRHLAGQASASFDVRKPYLQGLVFVDNGAVVERGFSEVKSDSMLTSAGLGFMLSFGPSVNMQLVLAQGLRTNLRELDEKRPRVHASLNFGPF